MTYRYQRTIFFLQIVADLAMILLALHVSYVLWELSTFRLQPRIQQPDLGQSLLIAVFFVILFYIQDGYERKSSILQLRLRKNLVSAMLMGCGLVIIYSFFTKTIALGRLQIFYFFFLMLFLVSFQRYLFDRIHTFLLRRGMGARRVLIFGAGDTGRRLATALERYPKMGYYPLGFVDDYKQQYTNGNPVPILGTLADLVSIIENHAAEEIIIAIPSAPPNRLEQVMQRCAAAGIPYRYVPTLYDTAIQHIRTEVIDGVPVFDKAHLHYTAVNAFMKRLFDVVLSALVILVTLPLVAVIGLAIRLDSPGPVFFRHQRVGKKGQVFEMWKFRTMFVDTPPYAVHPDKRDDPRITRAGRMLRRTSFDELPQFWNVLRGDMSIVGPRPEMPFIVETYTELQRERLNVRPGITGLWQVSADRALPIHENIDHDLFYIQNQSMLLDLLILAKTVWVALFGLHAR